jgi:hypothetical protein
MSLKTSIGSIKWIQALVSKGQGWAVGDIRQSFLTEVQFQSLNGSDWVLCDGRSVTGSSYETITGNPNIPDARGVFLRGKNNGRTDGNENPDGELSLGAYQADEYESHTHAAAQYHPNSAPAGGVEGVVAGVSSSGASGGNETRPKNVTVNNFVKIN